MNCFLDVQNTGPLLTLAKIPVFELLVFLQPTQSALTKTTIGKQEILLFGKMIVLLVVPLI